MRRILATIVLTSALVVNFSPGVAQRSASSKKPTLASQRGTDTINAAQLRDYLSFIASDEMEGRDTPSRGLDTVAKFIAMNLSRWGFKPAGDNGTFLQKIALRRDLVDKTETKVQLNNQTLALGDDYLPFPRAGELAGQMVFAGNGWFVKAKGIDAYKGIDPRGKIAIIFSSLDALPRGVSASDLSGQQGTDWMNPVDYAQKMGVIGLVLVPDFQFIANWERNRTRLTERGALLVEKFQTPTRLVLPGITASPRLANILFQGERSNAPSLFESIYGGQPFEPFPLSAEKKLSINVKVKSDAAGTQNVVGILEGSDPVLKNEFVAVGAHYDHVGIGFAVNGDGIYNGADDDGSGTTALLAMAEALAKNNTRPKRSVLFVWHTGEERGLWGSRYFTENPTVPLDKVVAQINIDMIGRSKAAGDVNPRNRDLSGPNEIYVIGSKMMSTELGELTEAVNSNYLNLTYNYHYDDPADPNRFFFRSDHYNYARKGIPIVFFFDGEHEDYHRPSDSADKIDYTKMEKVTRTIYMTLWEVASRPTRLKVDKQVPTTIIPRSN